MTPNNTLHLLLSNRPGQLITHRDMKTAGVQYLLDENFEAKYSDNSDGDYIVRVSVYPEFIQAVVWPRGSTLMIGESIAISNSTDPLSDLHHAVIAQVRQYEYDQQKLEDDADEIRVSAHAGSRPATATDVENLRIQNETQRSADQENAIAASVAADPLDPIQ